jgi:hypothetical protein
METRREKEKRRNLSRVSWFIPSRILLSSTAGRFRLTNCRQLTYTNICFNRKKARKLVDSTEEVSENCTAV